jgi:hypothetical protein
MVECLVDFVIAYATDVVNQLIGDLATLSHRNGRFVFSHKKYLVDCREHWTVIGDLIASLSHLLVGHLIKLSQFGCSVRQFVTKC